MENYQNRAILFIDGDNVTGSYAETIFKTLKKRGVNIVETRLFSTFKKFAKQNNVKKTVHTDNLWTDEIIYSHAIEVRYVPVLALKENNTDIAITVDAVDCALTREDADTYVIATDDKDFMPLAAYLRKLGMKTVILHREECKTVIAFDIKIKLKAAPSKTEKSEAKPAKEDKDIAFDSEIKLEAAPSKTEKSEAKPAKEDKDKILRELAKKIASALEHGYEGKQVKWKNGRIKLIELGKLFTKWKLNGYKQYNVQLGAFLRDEKYSDYFSRYKIEGEGPSAVLIKS